VKFPLPAGEASLGEAEIAEHNRALYGFRHDMVYLSPAPLYHAAPLRVTLAVQSLGGPWSSWSAFETRSGADAHRAPTGDAQPVGPHHVSSGC